MITHRYQSLGIPVNVFLISWYEVTQDIYIPKVAANVRVVVQQMALLLQRIEKVGFRPLAFDRYHLVGHSFGGQAMGRLGLQILDKFDGKRVGQVTAIDPADICYYRTEPYSNLNDSLSSYSGLKGKFLVDNLMVITQFLINSESNAFECRSRWITEKTRTC